MQSPKWHTLTLALFLFLGCDSFAFAAHAWAEGNVSMFAEGDSSNYEKDLSFGNLGDVQHGYFNDWLRSSRHTPSGDLHTTDYTYVSATADYGLLRGRVDVSTEVNLDEILQPADRVWATNTEASAAASTESVFSDTLHFNAPKGTLVHLRVGVGMYDNLSWGGSFLDSGEFYRANHPNLSPGYATLEADFGPNDGSLRTDVQFKDDWGHLGENSHVAYIDFAFDTQYSFELYEYLHTSSSAYSLISDRPDIRDACGRGDFLHCHGYGQEFVVNAGNTSVLSIELLDPGISYTSDSGTIYRTNAIDPIPTVPEPDSFALLIGGLAIAFAMSLAKEGSFKKQLTPELAPDAMWASKH